MYNSEFDILSEEATDTKVDSAHELNQLKDQLLARIQIIGQAAKKGQSVL